MKHLPILIAEIAEEFDLKTALEFVQEFGGQRMFIPLTRNTNLKDKINDKLLDFLIYRYGGCYVDVPAWHAGSQKQRAIKIQTRLEEGASLNQIAKETGVTLRTVSNHRKKQKEEEPPPLIKLLEE